MTENKEEVKFGHCVSIATLQAHYCLLLSDIRADGRNQFSGRQSIGYGGSQGCESYILYRQPALYLMDKTFESSLRQTKEVNFSGMSAVAWWPVKKSGIGIHSCF